MQRFDDAAGLDDVIGAVRRDERRTSRHQVISCSLIASLASILLFIVGVRSPNIAVGLGQGLPVGGGMSQSAVNEQAGAQTPASLLVASLVIAAVVLFLTGLFRNLPQPILAAVVLMAIKGLIDIRELRHLYRVSRFEFHVALAAAVGVLFFGVLNGVLLAAVAAVVLLVRRAARPFTAELGRVPGTGLFSDIGRNPGNERVPGALIARVEGVLLYFNVGHVQAELLRLVEAQKPPVSSVIFDMSGSPRIDLAGVRLLAQLTALLEKRGIASRLAEVRGEVRDLILAERLVDRLGIGERGLSVAELVAEELGRRSASPEAPHGRV